MALERWTGAGEGESRPTRRTGPPPGTGHTDGDGGRVTLLDGKPRHVIRDRFIRAAPAVAAASLLALAAAEAASLPGLVELLLVAVAAAALLAMRSEDDTLRHELRQARVTAVDATDLERSRIQADLHDSIQQRLISVRIRLADLSELAPADEVRQALDRLGGELDATLADIRSVTGGLAPQLLQQRGLREALREAIALVPLRITLEFRARGRYPADVERCVYFCCLEAIQNVLKHAGAKPLAWIRVTEWAGRLRFEVEDSGVGFDAAHMQPGRGISNLADRVGALGGHLQIDTHPGVGTRVRGEIPLA